MRPLFGLSFVLLAACSNACPTPAPLCSEPHPDYCPCMIVDSGSTPAPDAFVAPVDAFVEVDTGAGSDAGSVDAATVPMDVSDIQ